jgi:uncharacterized membrane protein YphA (DoxX/SURF4 family)
MGGWPRRLRPLLYVAIIFMILIMVLMLLGEFTWSQMLFLVLFIIVCVGIVWSRSHPEDDYTETTFG